jgi:hypothetical protein
MPPARPTTRSKDEVTIRYSARLHRARNAPDVETTAGRGFNIRRSRQRWFSPRELAAADEYQENQGQEENACHKSCSQSWIEYCRFLDVAVFDLLQSP